MLIQSVINVLENVAPPVLQESYDNAGLLTGDGCWTCTGVLCTLDTTRAVIEEAKARGCNLVVAHHPIIFGGLRQINGKNYVEQAVIAAIKHDVAIYAIHTNLDNVQQGVNGKIALLLGLQQIQPLVSKEGLLKKLYFFVPVGHAEVVREAVFAAGAGHIGQYSECSFGVEGYGTFKGEAGTSPFVGVPGMRHSEREMKIEVVFAAWQERKLVAALLRAHPYEEVAYDVVGLSNALPGVGSGLVGELAEPVGEKVFLQQLKDIFNLSVVRHTPLTGKPVKRVAVCGGAGSFLTGRAIGAGADVYVTADVKYHEFFDANDRLVIADIGHYESEQFTTDLLYEILQENFPTFAVLKSETRTNPVHYFI